MEKGTYSYRYKFSNNFNSPSPSCSAQIFQNMFSAIDLYFSPDISDINFSPLSRQSRCADILSSFSSQLSSFSFPFSLSFYFQAKSLCGYFVLLLLPALLILSSNRILHSQLQTASQVQRGNHSTTLFQ